MKVFEKSKNLNFYISFELIIMLNLLFKIKNKNIKKQKYLKEIKFNYNSIYYIQIDIHQFILFSSFY